MKKVMLPHQSAPVERTVNTAGSTDVPALEAQGAGGGRGIPKGVPFAGDDAE